MSLKDISDHSLVALEICARRPEQRVIQPISPQVAKSPQLKRRMAKLEVSLGLRSLEPFERWKIQKQLIREVARDVRNYLLQSLPNSSLAKELSFSSMARAVS